MHPWALWVSDDIDIHGADADDICIHFLFHVVHFSRA